LVPIKNFNWNSSELKIYDKVFDELFLQIAKISQKYMTCTVIVSLNFNKIGYYKKNCDFSYFLVIQHLLFVVIKMFTTIRMYIIIYNTQWIVESTKNNIMLIYL